MNKTFLTSKELEVNAAGYLVVAGTTKAVYHPEFVAAQEHANYIIQVVKACEGKDFVGKQAVSFDDVVASVKAKMAGSKVEYVSKPTEPKMPTKAKLAKEALDFVNFTKETEDTKAINDFMQQFNILKEFEEFGLYFSESIVKLEKIYTTKEIVAGLNKCKQLLK